MARKSLQVPLLIDKDLEALAATGVITPFEPRLLSGCSYDLRVGRVLRTRNRGRAFNLEKAEYYVESGECVTFETLETVDFRKPLLFGFVVNKHSVLAKGLVHPITKIDPGFHGPLAVTIFNFGNVAEPIRFEQPLVALVVLPVNSAPDRIYGVSQPPSYRQGSVDIASIINEPAEPLDDAGLAKMYGRPVARLYERVAELQNSVDAGLVKQAREKKSRRVDIVWRFVVAIFGGVVALGGKYLIDNWSTLFP